MDEEKKLQIDMEIIAHAGEAKSMALEAVRLAKKGDFPAAEQMLEQAERSANAGHNLHSDLLAYDAGGGNLCINFLTMHAADHMTAADVTVELTKEIVDLHRLVRKSTE